MKTQVSFETIYFLRHVKHHFPCIKDDKVKELRDLDSDHTLFPELIDIFHTEFLNRIPEMKAYASAGDYLSLAQVTHRFKSTAYNLGAIRAVEITKKIDHLLNQGPINKFDLEKLITSLEKECISAYQVLKFYSGQAA